MMSDPQGRSAQGLTTEDAHCHHCDSSGMQSVSIPGVGGAARICPHCHGTKRLARASPAAVGTQQQDDCATIVTTLVRVIAEKDFASFVEANKNVRAVIAIKQPDGTYRNFSMEDLGTKQQDERAVEFMKPQDDEFEDFCNCLWDGRHEDDPVLDVPKSVLKVIWRQARAAQEKP